MAVNTHFSDGDNYQLRQVIFANTPKAIEQCKSIAQKFKGVTEIDTCKNIFDFLKNDIRYVADGGHQRVKLPSALLREKVGDCKSFSLFTGAILSNLGIGWKYVLVSYREDPTPTHIYVVTDSGIIIDAVYGTFNKEKQPTHKFYHKPDNMKISTISGIGSDRLKQPNTQLQQQRVQIGSIHMGSVEGMNSQAFIGAPRAFIWFRNSRGRDATKGEQLAWGTKAALNSVGRNIILQLFKSNAGGISTMLFDLCFKKENTVYSIPEAEQNALNNKINNYSRSIGYKYPSPTQQQQIAQKNQGQTLSADSATSTSSGSFFTQLTNLQSQAGSFAKDLVTKYKAAYDSVMGTGQYELYVKLLQYETTEKNKVLAKYSVTAPNPKASNSYNQFENKWWDLGGDPWDVNDAIQEGAKKSPRGKLFNYVIGIAQTRGLKTKDIPLVVRAIVNSVTGDKFSLDESGSYVMGKGISGEPVTTAVVLANTKIIISILSSLFGLFLAYKAAFSGEGVDDTNSNSEETQKLAYYLTNGYMTRQDAIDTGAPTPYIDELTVDGETIVKPEESWFKKKFGGGALTAGFGNLVLPLLIGVGAIIALNTAGKKKP